MSLTTTAITDSNTTDYSSTFPGDSVGIYQENVNEWLSAIVLASFLSLMCLVSLIGNVLVVIAVRVETKLHSFTNYFIVSLACADLLISVLVMPLAIIYQVLGRWPFSWWVCLSFTTLDILCCTSSILNLCAISLDRYWAIITPFEYPRKMTHKTCPIIIAAVWLLSALIAFAQIVWRYAIGQLDYEQSSAGDSAYSDGLLGNESGEASSQQCQISTDVSFRIFSSSSSFYVPLIVMLFTYSKIYAAAKKQQRAIQRQARYSLPSQVRSGSIGCNDNDSVQFTPTHDDADFHHNPNGQENGSIRDDTNTNYRRKKHSLQTVEGKVSASRGRKNTVIFSTPVNTYSSHGGAGSQRASMVRRLSTAVPQTLMRARRKLTNQASELKAFRILSVVMGAFIINWFPFFALYVFEGVCTHCIIPTWVMTLVVWLGYFNSSINPFIYVFCNRQFRMAFMKLLIPSRRGHRLRNRQISEHLIDASIMNEACQVNNNNNNNNNTNNNNNSNRRSSSRKASSAILQLAKQNSINAVNDGADCNNSTL
ncbi:putative G-protein coupled receptor No18 [Convolutriloba macropyga]|uniref:putative G-protein coupled receptor No18 n=1 Tax=Convolutriloba macropyga TaxID=536237 RepID=UPI003F5239A1